MTQRQTPDHELLPLRNIHTAPVSLTPARAKTLGRHSCCSRLICFVLFFQLREFKHEDRGADC